MFTSRTISGASLELLKVGEQGVVSRYRNTDPTIHQELAGMGLTIGAKIMLERRSPEFVVCTEVACWALTQPLIKAIYVRTQPS